MVLDKSYQMEVTDRPIDMPVTDKQGFIKAHGIYIDDKLALCLMYRERCKADDCFCEGWYICDPSHYNYMASNLASMEVARYISKQFLASLTPKELQAVIYDNPNSKQVLTIIAKFVAVCSHVVIGLPVTTL